MAEIIGLSNYNDNEAVKHNGALRIVFLQVEKWSRWCFEDVVDPNEVVDVHNNRF